MRPQDPELLALFKQFVPVRITNFKGVDLNRFRFDYDLTFAVLMMDRNGQVFSRFGTHGSESATSHMSIAGLKNAMRGVLADYRKFKTKRPPPQPLPKRTLADIPAFTRMKAAREEC